jgi:hypothetical protein
MSAPPPVLPYDSWMAAKDTLHLWCQVVGKTKLALTARRNHWWNVTLLVSARGLTTARLPEAVDNLELELDLVDHRLLARTTHRETGFDLVDGLSVAPSTAGSASCWPTSASTSPSRRRRSACP